MKILLHVLVWIPTVAFLGLAISVLCAWIFFGAHINQDLANRAAAAGMIGFFLLMGSAFISMEVMD